MDLKDLIVTPIYLLFILAVAYYYRQRYVDRSIQGYFFPALLLKIVSAILLGLLYQFYYKIGDTFAYFDQGRQISELLYTEPMIGLKLLFSNGNYSEDTYRYASQMYYYNFPPEFFMVKLVGVLGLFTWTSYAGISILFAFFSFSGLWVMYTTWLKIYPTFKRSFAFAIFFIPSVIFWGSGILKDTVVLGSMGWIFFFGYQLVVKNKNVASSILWLIVFCYLIYIIKLYILLSFLPPFAFFLFSEKGLRIRNKTLRLISVPAFISAGLLIAYFITIFISEGDEKYDLNQIGERVRISSEWIYYVSQKEGGSGYYLGKMDGSFESMVRLAPNALNVTLFRPYIWEVRNPLMLLSSIEASFFLIVSIFVILRFGPLNLFKIIFSNPFIIMALSFTIILGVGAGLSSYNFGSLARYKIPILPFYASALFIIVNAILRKNQRPKTEL